MKEELPQAHPVLPSMVAAAPAREFLQQEKEDPGNTADGSRYHFQPTGQLLPGIPSLL